MVKILPLLTERNLKVTCIAFRRNGGYVFLTKMLVAVHVNISIRQAKRETYIYHLWLQNFTLRPLTTLLCEKKDYGICTFVIFPMYCMPSDFIFEIRSSLWRL
jgi:hypothetical protein